MHDTGALKAGRYPFWVAGEPGHPCGAACTNDAATLECLHLTWLAVLCSWTCSGRCQAMGKHRERQVPQHAADHGCKVVLRSQAPAPACAAVVDGARVRGQQHQRNNHRLRRRRGAAKAGRLKPSTSMPRRATRPTPTSPPSGPWKKSTPRWQSTSCWRTWSFPHPRSPASSSPPPRR